MRQNFFASLFDLSFTSFITPRLIKFLYVLGILLAAIVAMSMIGYSALYSAILPVPGGFLFSLIPATLYFLLTIIWVRVFLEVAVVAFRTWERVSSVASPGPAPSRVEVPAPPSALAPAVAGPLRASVSSASDMGDLVTKLEKLKSLLDSNAISQEEFDREKANLLNS